MEAEEMSRELDGKEFESRIRELEQAVEDLSKTEKELRESESRYRAVVEDMPAMICRFLPDGTLTFVNSIFCAYFMKYKEELIGQNFFELFSGAQRNAVRDHFKPLGRDLPMAVYEHREETPDGNVLWQEWINRALVDGQSNIVEYQSIGRDITEQKHAQDERAKLERQIQQAQKVEAIGALAGGISHDFNNILSSIIGYSELSMLYLPEDSPTRENIKQILESTRRAKELVNLIELISLESEPVRAPVQLHRVIEEALQILRASMPAAIELDVELASENDTVLCDSSQLLQVVINLCNNAHYSMRDRGGTLTVKTRHIELKGSSGELESGPYIRLTVEDTGRGMSRRMMERIFDPYFTTKEKNMGTGLGLAVVRGIVKKIGGTIMVHSTPEKGTRFTVLLPRMAGETAVKTDASEFEPWK